MSQKFSDGAVKLQQVGISLQSHGEHVVNKTFSRDDVDKPSWRLSLLISKKSSCRPAPGYIVRLISAKFTPTTGALSINAICEC